MGTSFLSVGRQVVQRAAWNELWAIFGSDICKTGAYEGYIKGSFSGARFMTRSGEERSRRFNEVTVMFHITFASGVGWMI